MIGKADYYRTALARCEAYKVLLAKASAGQRPHDSRRLELIRSARALHRRTLKDLAAVAGAPHSEWESHKDGVDRDLDELKAMLEELES